MKIFIVDRQQFIMWTQGVLLKREGDEVIAVDEIACGKAQEYLDSGGKIFLTVDGEVVTAVEKTKAGYVEKKVKGVEIAHG